MIRKLLSNVTATVLLSAAASAQVAPSWLGTSAAAQTFDTGAPGVNDQQPDGGQTPHKNSPQAWLNAPRTGAYATPYDFGATCNGSNVDDTAAVQSAVNKVIAQNATGGERGIIDFRGGTCAISAPITFGTGTPYDVTIRGGAIIPFKNVRSNAYYSGVGLDFSGLTTFTNIEIEGMSINGFRKMTELINLGTHPQGIWIHKNNLSGFVRHAIYSAARKAGTGIKITENEIEGGTDGVHNSGIGIELGGNDGEIRLNDIANINVAIKLNGGSWTVALNHAFPISGNAPVPLLWANGVSQLQIIGNYWDDGYLYFQQYASINQIIGNRFLKNGNTPNVKMTLPNGATDVPYSPIVLSPGAAGAAAPNYFLFDFMVVGNNFINTLGSYKPVYIDTTFGNITRCASTSMAMNGFSGYKAMYTEPKLKGTLSGRTTAALNFATSTPWCAPTSITSLVAPGAAITSAPIAGSTVTLNMSDPYTGPYNVGVTVNGNSSTDGN